MMLKHTPAISVLYSVRVTLTNHYWVTSDKRRRVIQYQQKAQHKVLRWGTGLLLVATLSLIVGAGLVGICSSLILFNH
jgi:hypothetical protein